MDELQRSIYGDRFARDFARKDGVAFQDWFAKIAAAAFGPDFDPIRPYGKKGDLKCDGRRLSTGTVFQCYAPYDLKDVETIKKIDEDFYGALEHWPDFLKTWTFVHNDYRGLPATVSQHLDALRTKHPDIKIEIMSEAQLRDIVMQLEVHHLEDLFGPAPTMRQLDSISLDDLKPVLDEIARVDPDPLAEDYTGPSARKLEKNGLSEDAVSMLRIGRRRQQKVADYFDTTARPDVADRIAEAFRSRYDELKGLSRDSEWIFERLQKFAGMSGDARRQAAALAVLAYFFERCDIFEDPDEIEQAGI